jgi:predicted GTPase
VFGETGAGKSSVINMLDGDGDKAEVSSSAKAVTFASTRYQKTIKRTPFTVFDTVGLSNDSPKAIDSQGAFQGLSRLVHQLEDGVSLLVYVMRGLRITECAQKNYEMFYTQLCQRRVPIIIVITGLENELDMDDWWIKNKPEFDKHRMKFHGCACITASKGKFAEGKHRWEEEYSISKKKVEDVIYASRSPEPWRMEARSWLDICAQYLHTKVLGMVDNTEQFIPNIVFFGETGVGKSSAINMLDGGELAPVENGAAGQTFACRAYRRRIYGTLFNIVETAGLGGVSQTKSAQPARQVIEELYKLICQLEHGVHLLVFVIRPRLTRTVKDNYDLFHQIFCQRKVRVVLLVVGLETNMDSWWETNGQVLWSQGISFDGQACITAIRGKQIEGKYAYEEEWEKSKEIVEKLIFDTYARKHPWKMQPKSWFRTVVASVHNILVTVAHLERTSLSKELRKSLTKFGGLPEKEAIAEARRIESSVRTAE